MRERPILFSAPMVRAILAGTKTQTRRPVKLAGWKLGEKRPNVNAETLREEWLFRAEVNPARFEWRPCPYGQPGDRLWVREAWRAPTSCDELPPRSISDSEAVRFIADEVIGSDPGFGKGRPGMFMPRWASRITLEITGVRVKRLQDISEADAVAEGVTAGKYHGLDRANARAYSYLWESINGPGSWDANPWVWVVEFQRCDQEGGAA